MPRQHDPWVAEIVYAVTDELGRNRKERKEKTYPRIAANKDAIAVKLCDRIANVQESSKTNHRLYKMYQKEQADFKAALNLGHKQNQRLWELLEFALKDEV